jgi:hypothetical protein
MKMDLATIIGLIIAFIAVVGGVGVLLWFALMNQVGRKEERLARIENRAKERMALIEKGMDPNLADQEQKRTPSHRALLFGLIIVMACVGRIIVYFTSFRGTGNDQSMLFILPALFAGVGVLIYHFYQKWYSSGKKR